HLWQSIKVAFRPAEFNRNVLALDEARFAQAVAECRHQRDVLLWRTRVQISDHRHCRLLPSRRERPRSRRTAEQRDELAFFHSITSSARASKVGGTSRPSDFAVLRLMTSSYLVGACTGRSAGFSPRRMRST